MLKRHFSQKHIRARINDIVAEFRLITDPDFLASVPSIKYNLLKIGIN